MKIVVFTTPTKHHIYFVNKIYTVFDISAVIYEKRKLLKKYVTGPFFEKEQDTYEDLFFEKAHGGVKRTYPEELERKVITVHSVNQPGIDAYITALAPDVIISFGAGLISPRLINLPTWGMLNLHGGLTQYYRGLDSTLWACYYEDFDKLGITVHYVEPELDTGDILAQKRISIEKHDRIYHFRYKITKEVTEMMLNLLQKFSRQKGRLDAVPMQPRGRYFSAMDLRKKYIALDNFQKYQQKIFHSA